VIFCFGQFSITQIKTNRNSWRLKLYINLKRSKCDLYINIHTPKGNKFVKKIISDIPEQILLNSELTKTLNQ